MSEWINAANNSWPHGKIAMLFTMTGVLGMLVWLTHHWLTLRKTLPDNVLLALAQEGETITLTVRKAHRLPPTS